MATAKTNIGKVRSMDNSEIRQSFFDAAVAFRVEVTRDAEFDVKDAKHDLLDTIAQLRNRAEWLMRDMKREVDKLVVWDPEGKDKADLVPPVNTLGLCQSSAAEIDRLCAVVGSAHKRFQRATRRLAVIQGQAFGEGVGDSIK